MAPGGIHDADRFFSNPVYSYIVVESALLYQVGYKGAGKVFQVFSTALESPCFEVQFLQGTDHPQHGSSPGISSCFLADSGDRHSFAIVC